MMEDAPPTAAATSVVVPPDAPRIGYGRYSLVSKIAEGGMAGVYKAWDHQLRVWRAIKVLSPEFARRSVLRGRFETEATTMARIDDPNVIQVYDVGTREALPYMVMELAEGGTINHWLETYGTMPPRMAVSVALQSARGLHAAHLLGVVHRDVKPHNLLVTADGQCKVADFGIARVLLDEGEDVTRTGAAMGTIGYMAPEQKVDARSVDPRADIYGLGALLYKLVHGRIVSDLFLVEHRQALLEGLPSALRPIVLTACYHDRDRRYADAPTMIRALREAVPSLPETPPDTPSLVMPMLASMRDYTAGFPELEPLIGQARRSPVPLPYTMPRPVRSRRGSEEGDAPSYVVPSTPPRSQTTSPPVSSPARTILPTLRPPSLPPRPSPPERTVPPLVFDRIQSTTLVPNLPAVEQNHLESPAGIVGIGVAAGAGLLILLCITLTALGTYTVRERREERDIARAGLYHIAEQEKSVLQDLATRGAPRSDVDRLAELYGAFVGASVEPLRAEAAEIYVGAVQQVGQDVLAGQAGGWGDGSMTIAKLSNLQRAWSEYQTAEARLQRASSGVPGRLARGFGLDEGT